MHALCRWAEPPERRGEGAGLHTEPQVCHLHALPPPWGRLGLGGEAKNVTLTGAPSAWKETAAVGEVCSPFTEVKTKVT